MAIVGSIPELSMNLWSGQHGSSFDWDKISSGDSNNDQSVGCLQHEAAHEHAKK